MSKFSDELTRLMNENDINDEELSERLNVSRTTVTRWRSGIRSPKMDKLSQIASIFHTDPRIFVGELAHPAADILPIYNQLEKPRQQKVYNFASDQLAEQNTSAKDNITQFPTVEEREDHPFVSGRETAAGAPIDGDYQDSNATITIDNRVDIPDNADEILTIAGDSMEPVLHKGQQVFIHWQPELENGEIGIVSITDEGVTCKKVYQEDDKIRLVSINEAYDDMVFDCDDVRIIGKVLM